MEVHCVWCGEQYEDHHLLWVYASKQEAEDRASNENERSKANDEADGLKQQLFYYVKTVKVI